MNRPVSVFWLAGHEMRLAWRDFHAMMSYNNRRKPIKLIIALGLIFIALHFLAYLVLADAGQWLVQMQAQNAKAAFVLVTAFLFLPAMLTASQAMENITRAFYARSDLELILSSPAPAKKLYAVRMGRILFSTMVLTLLVSAPGLNSLALTDQIGWLAAYGVIIGFALLATSLAIVLTMALFAIAGPAKTRLVAQIVAAIVGAGFVIGIQIGAIASFGTLSRFEMLQSPAFQSALPDAGNLIWWPARAAMGDWALMASFALLALGVFVITVTLTANSFARTVLKAASAYQETTQKTKPDFRFFEASPQSVLRKKEWQTLLRDKWLLSQTLMQLLYLLPPAFMLWQGAAGKFPPELLALPVIVMATGQLAGGLAWLAISGEDAPELVATAPISSSLAIRAKIEAVILAVLGVTLPITLILAFTAPKALLICVTTIIAAVFCSTLIQLWYRTQAKRSNFRKRQTSSKFATIAEAFSSILWAATAFLAYINLVLAAFIVPLIAALLGFTWWLSPAKSSARAKTI